MLINVAQLVTGPIGSTKAQEVDLELEGAEDSGPASLKGTLNLMRTDGGILVQGTLRAVVQRTCVRCLAIFDRAIDLDVEEEYVPVQEAHKRQGIKTLKAEGLLVDQQHILDLDPALREYVVVSSPIKPLCRPNCAGLCAQCGTDLNKARCACSEASAVPSDTRLAGLRSLAGKYKTKLSRNPPPSFDKLSIGKLKTSPQPPSSRHVGMNSRL